MPKQDLPRFIVYQPNQKEYHICFEIKGKYVRWCSYYPPVQDVRYTREVNRIKDIAVKDLPKKQVYDKGTYSITKADKGDDVEKRMAEQIKKASFAFTLNGKKLKGRFAFKKVHGGTVIQKYKDKYAKEEDVLSGDLSRTISTMVPDYDETKITLRKPAQTKARTIPEPEEEPIEPEMTADKRIGNTNYHFVFYSSQDEQDICLITNEKGEALVLKKEGRKWVAMPPVARGVLKKEKELADHAAALYDSL